MCVVSGVLCTSLQVCLALSLNNFIVLLLFIYFFPCSIPFPSFVFFLFICNYFDLLFGLQYNSFSVAPQPELRLIQQEIPQIDKFNSMFHLFQCAECLQIWWETYKTTATNNITKRIEHATKWETKLLPLTIILLSIEMHLCLGKTVQTNASASLDSRCYLQKWRRYIKDLSFPTLLHLL